MTDPVGSDLARAAAARLAHVERGRGFRLRPSGAPGAERERSFRFDRVEGAEVLVRDERAGSSLRFPLEEVARRGELGGHAAVGCAVAGGLLPALAC
ncbi:MAG TPA: hypothetical protein VKA84_24090, partial [Gemmatimonadaceae bacterium]|nr:hypothetical protein [Gemmatimonadaceae bacterium]